MKHVVTITTSNPSHEHVSLRRRQSTTNFMVEAADEEQAILRASAHFRKLGHYIHEAKIFKKKDEQLDESAALARPLVTAARIALPSLVAAAKTPLAKVADVADDVVDVAKKVVTRSKQVGTHNKETNLGSVVQNKSKPTTIALPPVPTVTKTPAPIPLPSIPTKPSVGNLPSVAGLTAALFAAKDKVAPKTPEPDASVKTDVVDKSGVATQTQTQSAAGEPPPPTNVDTGSPGSQRSMVPPILGLQLGDRGEIDIGTLGQYRGMFPLYRFADPYSRRTNMQEKVSLNAIGRVMSKRKKDNKEDAEGEKNKINMEPKLKTGGKQ